MQPISKKTKFAIEENYIKHKSLRKVSRILGISPNTVKKYASIKIKVKTNNLIYRVKSTQDLLIGAYVGIWAGDGTQYFDNGYCIKICSNKSNALLNQFIQEIISSLFGKISKLSEVTNTKQAYIRFYSKFIYYFIHEYVAHSQNKTHTIKLKSEISHYSQEFLEGFLLGLTLTDGYIKNRFMLNVTSTGLANNTIEILNKMGFHPTQYIHKREKYGWKDLHMVRLNKEESKKLEILLDNYLSRLGCQYPLRTLKYNEKI